MKRHALRASSERHCACASYVGRDLGCVGDNKVRKRRYRRLSLLPAFARCGSICVGTRLFRENATDFARGDPRLGTGMGYRSMDLLSRLYCHETFIPAVWCSRPV